MKKPENPELAVDYDTLLLLGIAANEAIVAINSLQGVVHSTAMLEMGEEEKSGIIFNGKPSRRICIYINYAGPYPYFNTVFNGYPEVEGDNNFVAVTNALWDLEPPYSGYLVHTTGNLNPDGSYDPANNLFAHGPLLEKGKDPIQHPDYAKAVDSSFARDPLTADLADELMNILSIPKLLFDRIAKGE